MRPISASVSAVPAICLAMRLSARPSRMLAFSAPTARAKAFAGRMIILLTTALAGLTTTTRPRARAVSLAATVMRAMPLAPRTAPSATMSAPPIARFLAPVNVRRMMPGPWATRCSRKALKPTLSDLNIPSRAGAAVAKVPESRIARAREAGAARRMESIGGPSCGGVPRTHYKAGATGRRGVFRVDRSTEGVRAGPPTGSGHVPWPGRLTPADPAATLAGGPLRTGASRRRRRR